MKIILRIEIEVEEITGDQATPPPSPPAAEKPAEWFKAMADRCRRARRHVKEGTP